MNKKQDASVAVAMSKDSCVRVRVVEALCSS